MEEKDLSLTEIKRVEAMLKRLEDWQSSVYGSWEGNDYSE
jgi:hypothetical protein